MGPAGLCGVGVEGMSNETVKCGEPAALRYTWPGKDESQCCINHAMQIKNVAEAIGLHLQMISIGVSVNDKTVYEWPQCQSFDKAERK